MKSLVNGSVLDHLDIGDRGLAYGDGLFETIYVRHGEPVLWEAHLTRLTEGCSRLYIPWNDADSSLLEGECRALLADPDGDDGILKIIITRGKGTRGYSPLSAHRPTRILQFVEPALRPIDKALRGVAVRICSILLGCNRQLAGVKHLNRLEQVLASREWDGQGYDEGLMLDESERLIEGTRSNVFIGTKGGLVTPDLRRCGVAGVMRQFVMDCASELGIEVKVADVSLSLLMDAEEVFLCNSVMGIWPVTRIQRVEPDAGMELAKGPLSITMQEQVQQRLGMSQGIPVRT